MTSKIEHTIGQANEAFVWIWLPGVTEPVVAGRIQQDGEGYVFNYGASYLERESAIPIYEPELPLGQGLIKPLNDLSMASCIRDGSPDAWGRKVIINRLVGAKTGDAEINEITYLLESGSDRIGALDFQQSATEYVPRVQSKKSYENLLEAATCIEKGIPLTPALDQALNHGTAIGGARPKVLIDDGKHKLIAKFSLEADTYSVVKAEFIAMKLASASGLNVAPVSMGKAAGKDILLIERFDRIESGSAPNQHERKAMVSALTMFGLDEMMARYASYQDFAEIIRCRFTNPKKTLKELYGRICFNILCGNTDDHARNHAAFWDGKMLTLTPAYDICPQSRTGNEASQAMLIKDENRMSTLQSCIDAVSDFQLSEDEAVSIIKHQIVAIAREWNVVCDSAKMTKIERKLFAGRQFLNPYCLEGLKGHEGLHGSFIAARETLIAGGGC